MRNQSMQHRARVLCVSSTDAERHLWKYLPRRQLAEFRFRRQVPILAYIVDFACLETKLAIELDGGQHAMQRKYDHIRDAELASLGFRVLRFWNNEVLQSTEAVLEQILRELAPTLTLPR